MFENIYYWPKPKWMPWKTFEQKRKSNNRIRNETLAYGRYSNEGYVW